MKMVVLLYKVGYHQGLKGNADRMNAVVLYISSRPFEYGYVMAPTMIGYRSVEDQPDANLVFSMPGTYKVRMVVVVIIGYSIRYLPGYSVLIL